MQASTKDPRYSSILESLQSKDPEVLSDVLEALISMVDDNITFAQKILKEEVLLSALVELLKPENKNDEIANNVLEFFKNLVSVIGFDSLSILEKDENLMGQVERIIKLGAKSSSYEDAHDLQTLMRECRKAKEEEEEEEEFDLTCLDDDLLDAIEPDSKRRKPDVAVSAFSVPSFCLTRPSAVSSVSAVGPDRLIRDVESFPINPNYYYDDEDIKEVLNAVLAMLKPAVSIRIGNAAQLNAVHPAATREELAATFAAPNSIASILRSQDDFSGTLLIPCCVTHLHWVGLVCEMRKGQCTRVDFFDSLPSFGERAQMNVFAEVSRQAASVNREVSMNKREDGLLQKDHTSCGPVMVLNGLYGAGLLKLDGCREMDMQKIRKDQAQLLADYNPVYLVLLNQKQWAADSAPAVSVSAVESQGDGVIQKDLEAFLSVWESEKNIGIKAEVIDELKKSNALDAKTSLDTLRVFMACKLNDPANSGNMMLAVLTEVIFGVKRKESAAAINLDDATFRYGFSFLETLSDMIEGIELSKGI